jgi:predicted protein tyrosine phosphatase
MRLLVLCLILILAYVHGKCVTSNQCDDIRLYAEYWKPIQNDPYNDADLIIDRLYLGNVCAAHNTTWLKEHNIGLIISVASEWQEACSDVKLLSYNLDDRNSENETKVREIFEEVVFIIVEYLSNPDNSNILVHCNMGISRSSSVVLAFLQRKYPGRSYKQLLRLVKARRPVIRPNNLFGSILLESEL